MSWLPYYLITSPSNHPRTWLSYYLVAFCYYQLSIRHVHHVHPPPPPLSLGCDIHAHAYAQDNL